MTQELLRRTGDLPLSIETETTPVLYEGDTKTAKQGKRWHRLRVFGGGAAHVVAIEYHSDFEPEYCTAFEAATLLDAFAQLKQYDPLAPVSGLPERTRGESKQNAPRNKILREDVRGRWLALLSHAAEKLGLTQHSAGRPTLDPSGETAETVSVRFPRSQLAKIDQLRGEASRSEFVRKATDAFILIKTS